MFLTPRAAPLRGLPNEMGALTAFLCSAGAGYMNGVDILADGGQNAGIFVPQI